MTGRNSEEMYGNYPLGNLSRRFGFAESDE
jgi:hypothetical protein